MFKNMEYKSLSSSCWSSYLFMSIGAGDFILLREHIFYANCFSGINSTSSSWVRRESSKPFNE